MSIVFASVSNGAATSVLVTPASGQLAGDLREVRIAISNQTVTTPSGWSLVSNTVVASTRRLYVFRRTATLVQASEPNYTFTFSASAQYALAQFHLRNWDTGGAYDVDATIASNAANQTSMVASAVSPVGSHSVLIHSYHQFTASATATFSTPSGMTALGFTAGNGADGPAVGLYYEVRTASGSTGTRTSTSNTSAPWAAASSATAEMVVPAASALSATSSLAVGATPVRPGAAALSSDSTLIAGAIPVRQGAVALSATSSINAAGTIPGPVATLVSDSSLTVGGTADRAAAATLAASSTLTSGATGATTGAASLLATSALSVAGTLVHPAQAVLAATSALTAGASPLRLGAVVLAATSTLTATGTGPGYAELQWFDMQALVNPPGGYLEPMPLTLGPNWQPNDIRILLVSASATSGDVTQMIQMSPDPPTGFTPAYALNPGDETQGVYFRRLQSGDTNTSVAWVKPPGWRHFNWALLTVRGVDPGTDPVAGTLSVAHIVGDAFCDVASVSVPGTGDMAFCLGTVPDPEGGWPSWATSIGVPTGWKHMAATDKSGDTFYSYDTNPALAVVGKKFVGPGSTGTVTFPLAQGAPAFAAMYLHVRPAPDVPTTIGAVAETDAASAITSTPTTLVSSSISPAEPEVDLAGQVFTGLGGFRISDPLALSGNPVTASRVEWIVTPGDPGSTFLVEISINNGASWDLAVNGGRVPRLAPEDTATRSVLTRVTMTRLDPSDVSPEFEYLRVAVTDDASTVEMVHVGHGIVDKVNVKVSSADGASGGAGGPGVVGKGGGQAGGGTSIKIHAVDLSKAVSRNVWSSPFVIPTGINYAAAARRWLLNRLPGHTEFSLCTTTRKTLEPFIYGLQQGTDPWQDLQEFLIPAGLECYFDAAGVFVLREIPDPAVGVPVWTIDDDAHPVITSLDKQLTGEQTFNYITVKGEGTSTTNPVSAVAFDDDPLSATYVLGDYGVVSVTITLPGLVTPEQAQTAANAILRGSLGGAEVVTITMVPNPALEPGDLVIVDVLDAKVSGVYLINGLSWSPSQADPMQLICFKQISRS